MSKTVFMRGLQNFIQDIRGCQNKEQEQRRVDKELAKIREKFGDDKNLDGYDKRKYVWKLLYIYMLGYDIDFGHRQACDLIPKPKYKDKQVGYMACSILLHEGDEFLRLAINGIHQDLTSRNEAFECLALSFIGSVGGGEMAEALVPDILKLLSNGATRPLVKKRAALCLLKMIRKTSADQQVVNPDSFVPTLNDLLEEHDIGLLLASVTLLSGILARNGPVGYEPCQARLIRLLERLTGGPSSKPVNVAAEYLFYGIPSPWLQAKCLRALQYFPAPEVPAERNLLNSMLEVIIDNTTYSDGSKTVNPNKANAVYAIMFEAISLALHMDTDPKLLSSSVGALGRFLSTKEANIKYLALEALARLALLPDILAAIRHHQPTVLEALRDPDISIRKKAMDLLFTMCDASNAPDLVGELLAYLVTADFAMREELVLKIAILAEKFAPNVQWYVDTAMHLLERAGDFVNEDIWHRVVQLVTNNESMQEYAARNMVALLKRGANHESVVCTAAYLLGEYGRLIKTEVPPMDQFKLLNTLFATSSQSAKGLLMTAFIKIYLQAPEDQNLKKEVVGIFERFQRFMDAELQQRAAEYLTLADQPQAASEKFLLPMPKWPERESTLLRQLQKREGVDEDAAAAAAGLILQAELSPRPLDSSPRELAAPATAPPPPAPPVDLLGDEAPLAASTSDPFAVLQSSASGASPPFAAAAKPVSSNPVDLLADLFADTFGAASAPMPQPAPAPSALHAASSGTAVGAGAAGNSFNASFPAAAPAPVAPPLQAAYPQALYGGNTLSPAAPLPPYFPGGVSPASAAPAQAYPPPGQAQVMPVFTPFGAPASPVAPAVPVSRAVGDNPTGGSNSGSAVGAPVPPTFGGTTGSSSSSAFVSPVAAFNDPFGDDQAFGVSLPPAVPMGNFRTWFESLLYKDRGILYEDQYIQVGVQARYSDGRGDFVLFIGNKSVDHELGQVVVAPVSSTAVTATVAALVPTQILPKQQIQVPIQLTCLRPIADVPTLSLAYVVGNQAVRQQLQVPVANHKFLVPDATVAKELFFEQWKLFGQAPNKAQEMIHRDTPITLEPVMAAMKQLGLGVEHGALDPSPHNEAGAGYFVYGAPGAQQRTLLMCRVEGNPQNMGQFRVTVASLLPELSLSTKDSLVARLMSLKA